jgi:hypothetical protein
MARRRVAVAGAVVAIALATSLVVPVARADDPPDPIGIGPLPIPPLPIPPLFPPPAPPPKPAPACSSAERSFVPKSMDLMDVAEGVPVVALPRDRQNNPGVPPLDREGKSEMAFDLGSGIRPGDPHGNALFNAHTWPDGSALGNRLLAELHKGDRIVVRGQPGWICYRVTDREEVSADSRGMRYYSTTGDPQIAIAVCSGKRVGPGRWTKRTLWYASPIP